MLQIKLEWTDNSVSLSQNRQIESLKKKFNVCDSKRVFTTPMETKLKLTKGDANNLPDIPYRELVCSLLFIARYTRPDILFAVTLLCRFLTNYTEVHWKAVKRVLCYTASTTDRVLRYTRNVKAPALELYTDSDWGSDQIDGRSTSGVLLLLYGNPVTWSTEKQTNVALSTSEAEYIAITSGFKEAKYFINLMQVEMKLRVTPIRSRVDNIGAGYMAEQSVTNKRTAETAETAENSDVTEDYAFAPAVSPAIAPDPSLDPEIALAMDNYVAGSVDVIGISPEAFDTKSTDGFENATAVAVGVTPSAVEVVTVDEPDDERRRLLSIKGEATRIKFVIKTLNEKVASEVKILLKSALHDNPRRFTRSLVASGLHGVTGVLEVPPDRTAARKTLASPSPSPSPPGPHGDAAPKLLNQGVATVLVCSGFLLALTVAAGVCVVLYRPSMKTSSAGRVTSESCDGGSSAQEIVASERLQRRATRRNTSI